MANPSLLVIDSDVLAQIFLTKSYTVLSHIKSDFSVQASITVEVDLELRYLGRFRDRFEKELDKALKNEVLVKLDLATFQRHLGEAPPGASWNSFQVLGRDYGRRVDRGEAYTHAAGLTLGVPTASNDFRAVQTLDANGLLLPSPVLRTFDLYSFAYESGFLRSSQVDQFRRTLLAEKEGIPKAFLKSSFEDGLKSFQPRLRVARPGLVSSPQQTAFSTLFLTRLAPRASGSNELPTGANLEPARMVSPVVVDAHDGTG